jgi:probable F420-dependent oxidoreductase
MELTKFGVWVGRAVSPEDLPEAAALAQELGFGAFWLGFSPQCLGLRPLLAATDQRITIATGIVNVWAYEPATLAAEFNELDQEFPGRTLLGIGVGHPEATSEYMKPLEKMRGFFDGLAAATPPVPRERLVAAALGPKMLDLSFERSLGTHPYFTPPEHTKYARERLGPDALIAPELAVVIDDDPVRAEATAREYASFYLRLTNYTTNLERFGYTRDEFEDGGSKRLLDAVVPQGSAEAIAEHVQAHLDAGADHVCVQVVGVKGVPRAEWTALAGVLLR